MNESIIQAAMKSADPMVAELAFKEIDTELSLSTDSFDQASLLLRKALLYGILKRFVEARKQISLALQTAPDDSDIKFRCEHLDALLYHDEQNTSEAFKRMTKLLLEYSQYQNLLDFKPVYGDIQQRRGFELVQLLRFEEAVPIFKECLSFYLESEDRAEVLADLGICYSHLKRYEEARDCFLQAREVGLLERTQGRVHVQFGIVYFHLNLLRESKQEFQLAEREPNESQFPMKSVYGWLAAVCRRLGEKIESEEYARLANPS
jgi:tetratricopeptide (TPR) repeat protein